MRLVGQGLRRGPDRTVRKDPANVAKRRHSASSADQFPPPHGAGCARRLFLPAPRHSHPVGGAGSSHAR
eukprot:5245254-Lingulodinium_polyedra.AAC.1